ncbi:CatB-related O-acetyltransferase [Escherichia coli]|uniref:CatB-related O-acetyltransferase n=1 Tax=Escherichia coli TaxID=562 RepID=UPI0010B672ED|nr:CatB-related O-acetyltransferase [Escherichia coli]GCL09481.1 acetyltransferase [Escherichia coli]
MINKTHIIFLKFICRVLIKKNQFESCILRRLYIKLYDVDIGMYSYGCFDPKRVPPKTKIGRYCSFAPTAYIFGRNHGVEFVSLHPYLYNSELGLVKQDTIAITSRVIEDDVWFGHNSVISPAVKFIGRGAVIATGAVVTSDVPRYAIVAGVPAKIIKYRFEPRVINIIEKSKWWLRTKSELQKMIKLDSGFIFTPGYFDETN